MKISMIALVVCALSSASAFAATVAEGQEAVSHAGRMMDAAQARVNDAQQAYNDAAYQQGGGVNGSVAEANLNKAASDRAAAQAQMNGAINTLANAVATQAGPMATPSVNPNAVLQATPTINTPQAVPTKQLTPSYSVPSLQVQQLTPQRTPSKQPQITGASYRSYVNQLQGSVINVSASSLKPNTPVNVTVDGVTQTVTASSLAPSIQVSVPFESAFMRTSVKGGVDSHSHVSSHVQGDNNGNSNQHANAMGAHGQNGQRSGRSAAGNF